MKRVLSFLLSIVIVISMASGTLVNVSAATQVEQIISHAQYVAANNPHGYDGYCLAFCGACYQAAGYPAYSMGDAYTAGTAWIQSTSSTNIPVGALVFYDYTWNSKYGHVGIYAGNGQMYDAESAYGGVKLRTFKTNGYRGWGWYGGIAPSGSGSSSGTSTTYNYQTITPGSYYVRSNGQSTYNYLAVSYGSADSGAAVNAWSFVATSRVQIANNGGSFYTMKFPDITTANAVNVHTSSTYPTSTTNVTNYKYSGSTTQSWGFDKVSGGYVIRCKANPNMVLTCNGSGQATITAYSAGNANQIWTLVPYISGTVNYNANGGSGAPASQTKYFNQALTISSVKPTRSGYTFKGWGTSSSDTSVNYSSGSSYTSEAGITLYAIWEKSQTTTYTIKYDANGGSGAPAAQTKTKGKSITLSSQVPTRFGYTFLGWSTVKTDATSGYYPGGGFSKDQNTTLYATWESAYELSAKVGKKTGTKEPSFAGKYYYMKLTPTYNKKLRFESTGSIDTQVLIYDASGKLLASDDNSGAGNNFKLEYTFSKGSTYYIKLLSKAKGTFDYSITGIYYVAYDANGGTGAPSTHYRIFDENVNLSSSKPSRSGYTFVKWSTTADGTGTQYMPGDLISKNANIKLYAIWKANSYKVTFNANGGSCSTSSKTVTYDSTYGTLPTPTKSGYAFNGWYTAKTGGTKISSSTKYTTVGNITLYAHWTQDHSHSYTSKITKEPTCTEAGIRKYTCSCGSSYTQSIAATGHTISDWIISRYPSADNGGYGYRNCKVCKEVLEEYNYAQYECDAPSLYEIVNTAKGVKIEWDDVYGADSYNVYRKTYNASTKKWSGWSRIKTGTTSTVYTDTTAKSGTYYRYTVIAKNEAGLSGYESYGLKIKFLSTPDLTSIANNTGKVTVKWNKVSGATGYIVYRRTYNATTKTWGGWSRIAKTKSNAYNDTTAKSGVYYRYTVRAYYSSYTSYFDTTGLQTKFLATPTLKAATSTKSGVKVTWGKVSGAKGYNVYRKTYNAKTKTWSGWSRIGKGVTATSYTDANVKSGVYYRYTVKAVSNAYTSYHNTYGLKIKSKYTPQKPVINYLRNGHVWFAEDGMGYYFANDGRVYTAELFRGLSLGYQSTTYRIDSKGRVIINDFGAGENREVYVTYKNGKLIAQNYYLYNDAFGTETYELKQYTPKITDSNVEEEIGNLLDVYESCTKGRMGYTGYIDYDSYEYINGEPYVRAYVPDYHIKTNLEFCMSKSLVDSFYNENHIIAESDTSCYIYAGDLLSENSWSYDDITLVSSSNGRYEVEVTINSYTECIFIIETVDGLLKITDVIYYV